MGHLNSNSMQWQVLYHAFDMILTVKRKRPMTLFVFLDWCLKYIIGFEIKLYCKLVKVRTLCILCNNWCLFRLGYLTPVWLGVALYTVLGQVSSPGQTDRLHTNRDRSSLVIESIIYDSYVQFSKFDFAFLLGDIGKIGKRNMFCQGSIL